MKLRLSSLRLNKRYLITRSLLAPMLLHFLNNALAFGSFKLVQNNTVDLLGMYGSERLSPLLFGASALALATVAWLLVRTRVQWTTPQGDVWSPGYVTAEMPPATLNATARRGRLRLGDLAAAFAVFAGLGGALYSHGIEGSSTWIHETRAYDAYERADYEEAIRQYTKAIAIEPDDARLLLNRGNTYEHADRLNEAIADYSEAIRLQPNVAQAYVDRGRAYMYRQDNERAIADLTQAIERGAATSLIYLDRARAFQRMREPQRALADCDEAIRLDPDYYYSHSMYGWILQELGQTEEAIGAFTEAIRLEPTDSFSFYCRAVALFQTGSVDGALADLDEARRLHPTDHHAIQFRATLRGRTGNWAGALDDFSSGIVLNANCQACLNGRAWLLATCPDANYRDGSKAIEDATRACELTDWMHYAFVDTLAAAYAEVGDFENAVHWQKQAIDLGHADRQELEARLEMYRAGTPYRERPY